MNYEEVLKVLKSMQKEKILSCKNADDGKSITALQIAIDAVKIMERTSKKRH